MSSSSQSIMVHMADRVWTRSALHSACAISRRTGMEVVLVRFINVPYVQWLGTQFGYQDVTLTEHKEIADHQATTEDYGIELSLCTMQYVTLPEAMLQAAEHLNAQTVFARLPNSAIPYWHRFESWWLQHCLHQQGREFYTLDQPAKALVDEWTPSLLASQPKAKK